MNHEETPMRTASVRRHRHDDAPLPGTWRIDPERAEAAFVSKHFLPGNPFGPFTEDLRIRVRRVGGTIVVADDRTTSSVDLVLDLTTATSGDRARDVLLRSADVLDVARHSTAHFSGGVVRGARSGGMVAGAFTFRGERRHVVLETAHHRFARDPDRDSAGVFLSVGVVDRASWGLRPQGKHPDSHLLLARDVRIELQLPAERAT
jgi:polyisoprenoid-binding protein YceI